MVTHWVRLASIIALPALSAASANAKPSKADPGWRCSIERRGAFGLLQSDFEVSDKEGPRSPYLRWDAGDGTFANPWITAAWFRRPDGRYSVENGYVTIMRHIHRLDGKRRPLPLKLNLELRTALNTPVMPSPAKFQRSAGPFHLYGDWSDVSALARGASRLYLVAMDTKGRAVDRVEIDRSIFDRAAPQVEATLAELEKMLRDPAKACVRSNDLRGDDIVVT